MKRAASENHVVIAAVANHKQRDITGRVYVRYTYDKEKRRALQAWGRRLEAIVHHRGDVIKSYASQSRLVVEPLAASI